MAGPELKVDTDLSGWESLQRMLESLRTGESYVKAGVCGPAAAVVEGHGEVARDAADDARAATREYKKESGRAAPTRYVREVAAESAAQASTLTNAQLAAIHEFGAPEQNIPARPFINGTFVLHRERYVRELRDLIRKVYALKTTFPFVLKFMGQRISSDMRNRMVEGAGIPPPNAPSTIARKTRKGRWNKNGIAQKAGAGPKPLIDTGRLRQSITYEVVIKEGR